MTSLGCRTKRKIMRLLLNLAIGTVIVALGASSAFAGRPPSHPGSSAKPSATSSAEGSEGTDDTTSDAQDPGPDASLPAKAKAYGSHCQDQSKRHVAGQTGTPFSQCVTAMARLAHGVSTSPRTACATMSKAHVAGEQGTPFSRCVASAAKLRKSKHQHP